MRRDGTEFQGEVACSLLAQDSDDAPVSMAVAVRDTSHRQAADAGLREAMSLLSATLESTADGILVVSGDGRIAGVNNQFISMWGIPRELLATQDDEAVMGFVLDQLVDPGQFVEKVTALYADPSAESHDVLDFRDGRTFERYSRPQKVADMVVGRVWSFRDVTPARIAQDRITQAMADLAEQAAQLKALAFKDGLTGLSNRQLFNDHLADGAARAVRHRRRRPAPGPGRLQGSQRHPGPPRRRPDADRGGPAAARMCPPERRCSTPGR